MGNRATSIAITENAMTAFPDIFFFFRFIFFTFTPYLYSLLSTLSTLSTLYSLLPSLTERAGVGLYPFNSANVA